MEQEVTKFEILPNELLIKCFQYLSAVDILLSFEQLNSRFHALVGSIQLLFVDFREINQSRFNEFCLKLSFNPELKNHIHSLALSNKYFCGVYLFLTRFLLDEFPNLQSMTFIEAEEHDISPLQANLSSLSRVSCLRLIDFEERNKESLSLFSKSSIQILQIKGKNSSSFFNISLLGRLTISFCDMYELDEIFESAPQLQYLKIYCLSDQPRYNNSRLRFNSSENTEKSLRTKTSATYLVIEDFRETFDNLESILKQMPKLQSLSICQFNHNHAVDADQWQHLIISSLPYLKVFKFFFTYLRRSQNREFHERYQQFQSDFWIKQHRWCTEYLLYKYYVEVYTIPYPLQTYTLQSTMERYSNPQFNHSNRFLNVKHLEIKPNAINDDKSCEDYFPHVQSMTIGEHSPNGVETFLNEKYLNNLATIVEMKNIKNLIIGKRCQFETSSILSRIFEQAPNLSSLSIDPELLMSLLNHNKLCESLNKMIKKLDLTIHICNTPRNFYEMNKFWKVFSNLEQLKCPMDKSDSIIFLLENLSKILRIDVLIPKRTFELSISTIQQAKRKFGLKIFMKLIIPSLTEYTLWIVRDINSLN